MHSPDIGSLPTPEQVSLPPFPTPLPPSLNMDSPRRLSTSSSSGSSNQSESSPILSNFNSSTSLILVHDDDDEELSSPFQFHDEDDDAPESPDFEIRRAYSPPMSASLVFLYLLSPYLKLGAIFLPNTLLPLKLGLPALFVFAILSAFSRQIWYMLARYTRKADLEDVILSAFASGRGREMLRRWLRSVVRGGTGLLRVLLAVIYLRESVHILTPLIPAEKLPFISPPVLTVLFSLLLVPFASAETLLSKHVIYATSGSLVTYFIWFCCVSISHAHGTLEMSPGWLRMGALWQGITLTAFVFTSSSTLPLYASLKAGTHHSGLSKSPARSFRTLSIISVVISLCFTTPLVFYTAHSKTVFLKDPSLVDLRPAIAVLNALTLLLGIPSILVTTPSLPIPERIHRSTNIPLSKYLIFALVFALSLVPTRIARILSDVLIACACAGTFFLPALIHITTHFFQRPLSIVMPAMPSAPNSQQPSRPSSMDELLQRKERALQKRQFRKRVIWDIGVWTLLLPVGGGGFMWGAGHLFGKW
ncbi:unnamed protein product [Mycena citricolor]|uniref:Amino acid transporter transmembrane domain-containing protein n=1 Tax=Mycena citricolor TaxID=2018698 RepID=A0AAD2K8X3_9AGAR|nr:unnamed protein product [Mycena citricolor]